MLLTKTEHKVENNETYLYNLMQSRNQLEDNVCNQG